jgi:hypothetical protein
MAVLFHQSRKTIEAFPAEVARTRLQNLQNRNSAHGRIWANLREVASPRDQSCEPISCSLRGNGVATQIGELHRGAPIPNLGGLLGGEIVVLQSPIEGYASIEGYALGRAFDPPNDTNLGGGNVATAVQFAYTIRLGPRHAVPCRWRSRFARTLKRAHR